jgi:hypothetical protein
VHAAKMMGMSSCSSMSDAEWVGGCPYPSSADPLTAACLASPACVRASQTKKGIWARTPQATEVHDIITRIWQAMLAHPKWPKAAKPFWGLDNVRVHRSAVSTWCGRGSWWRQHSIRGILQQLLLDTPDVHHVVEHATAVMSRHSRVCSGQG